MKSIYIAGLVIYTFGAWAMGTMIWLSWREALRCVDLDQGPETRKIRRISNVMLGLCCVWFVNGVLLIMMPASDSWYFVAINLGRLVMGFLFPPMIMHIYLVDRAHEYGKHRGESLSRAWSIVLGAGYGAAALFCGLILLAIFDVIEIPGRTLGAMIGAGIGGGFFTAAVFSVLLIRATRLPEESPEVQSSHRGSVGLLGFLALLAVLIVLANSFRWRWGEILGVVGGSLPLLFIFMGTYHEARFQFFDLLVKRGLNLIVTLLGLAAYFALIRPVVDSLPLRPIWWLHAVLLLPAALALPWLYGKIAAQVDRLWLGRRYTTVEAVKRFLSSIRSACTAPDLIERAEAGLREIFTAPARIRLGLEDVKDADGSPVVTIRGGERPLGVIVMGPRDNQTPYFSEDQALLESLADVFGYMLENVNLQEREKQLTVHASRSELKALRAQINPHFLFNALNAIAGLIHKDPQRADQAVEQLAEVFRYTLRGSESEWANLQDEVEFARSYLEVEQARFGERLSFDIEIAPAARGMALPTMMLQTLVENAVKHGVCEVRGPGRIEIRGSVADGRLRVEVADNGPGFDPAVLDEEREAADGTGYGLHNVRSRLRGYFGEDARLEARTNDGDGRTGITLEMPAQSRHSPRGGERSQGAA